MEFPKSIKTSVTSIRKAKSIDEVQQVVHQSSE